MTAVHQVNKSSSKHKLSKDDALKESISNNKVSIAAALQELAKFTGLDEYAQRVLEKGLSGNVMKDLAALCYLIQTECPSESLSARIDAFEVHQAGKLILEAYKGWAKLANLDDRALTALKNGKLFEDTTALAYLLHSRHDSEPFLAQLNVFNFQMRNVEYRKNLTPEIRALHVLSDDYCIAARIVKSQQFTGNSKINVAAFDLLIARNKKDEGFVTRFYQHAYPGLSVDDKRACNHKIKENYSQPFVTKMFGIVEQQRSGKSWWSSLSSVRQVAVVISSIFTLGFALLYHRNNPTPFSGDEGRLVYPAMRHPTLTKIYEDMRRVTPSKSASITPMASPALESAVSPALVSRTVVSAQIGVNAPIIPAHKAEDDMEAFNPNAPEEVSPIGVPSPMDQGAPNVTVTIALPRASLLEENYSNSMDDSNVLPAEKLPHVVPIGNNAASALSRMAKQASVMHDLSSFSNPQMQTLGKKVVSNSSAARAANSEILTRGDLTPAAIRALLEARVSSLGASHMVDKDLLKKVSFPDVVYEQQPIVRRTSFSQ